MAVSSYRRAKALYVLRFRFLPWLARFAFRAALVSAVAFPLGAVWGGKYVAEEVDKTFVCTPRG